MNNFTINSANDSFVMKYSQGLKTLNFKGLNNSIYSVNILEIPKERGDVFLKTRGKEIGSGASGTVYEIKNCQDRVYKFIDINKTSQPIGECEEILIANIASQMGLALNSLVHVLDLVHTTEPAHTLKRVIYVSKWVISRDLP